MSVFLLSTSRFRNRSHRPICTRCIVWGFLSLLTFPCAAVASRADSLPQPAILTETEKIELLIRSIETMPDARFIRNGKEYSSVQAGRHLRKKWAHVKKRITTADQFIEHIASKSSVSGASYLILRADGSTVTSEKLLRIRLHEIAPSTSDTLHPSTP